MLLLEAAAVAATFALGDRVALLALALLPLGGVGFPAAIAGWTLVAAIVVLPPAIIAGYQFPMLIALFGQGRKRLGRDVGLAYAANTGGAIVGSLAGGFGALPWLSAQGAWRLVAAVLVTLGLAAAVVRRSGREAPKPARTRSWIPGFADGITLLLLAAAGASGDLASRRHRRRPGRRAISSRRCAGRRRCRRDARSPSARRPRAEGE